MADQAVRVRVAQPGERQLIEELAQFYVYDFSEMEPEGSEGLEFNEHGRFNVWLELDNYWQARAGFHALVICVGERAVGFVLVNTLSHRGGPVERNMGEFFVGRKHRRRGVAREAVRQILTLYPGQWEVAVAERNRVALEFWPRAIAAAGNVSALVRHEGDGELWRGPIWSFRAAP